MDVTVTPGKFALGDFTTAIEVFLRCENARSVTVFQPPAYGGMGSPQRVRVARHGKLNSAGNTLFVTYGPLNYMEREYAKKFSRQGKSVPRIWIKDLQVGTRHGNARPSTAA